MEKNNEKKVEFLDYVLDFEDGSVRTPAGYVIPGCVVRDLTTISNMMYMANYIMSNCHLDNYSDAVEYAKATVDWFGDSFDGREDEAIKEMCPELVYLSSTSILIATKAVFKEHEIEDLMDYGEDGNCGLLSISDFIGEILDWLMDKGVSDTTLYEDIRCRDGNYGDGTYELTIYTDDKSAACDKFKAWWKAEDVADTLEGMLEELGFTLEG